ncbi:MAG: BrnT family toxin [Thermodesulfovibrionales bacterium]
MDARKSVANSSKHGIDFETAKALWFDENRIEIEAPHPVEERRILIARFQGKFWTAVYTMRDESNIRLISVRRSRDKEVAVYEKERTG